MSLHEKVSWLNLFVLSLVIVLYLIFFISDVIEITNQVSFILFIFAIDMMILCNFGFIIFYDKRLDPDINQNELKTENEGKTRLYPYFLYWGSCFCILFGTLFWVINLSKGKITKGIHDLIMFSTFIILCLWIAFLMNYKKRKGDAIETTQKYTLKDIFLQRKIIGYDERDLIIRKTAKKMGYIALSTVCFIGAIYAVLWAKSHPGIVTFSINSATIILVVTAGFLFNYIVSTIAIIIQYRTGK